MDDVDEPCRKQLLQDASIDTKNKRRLNLGALALAMHGPATTVQARPQGLITCDEMAKFEIEKDRISFHGRRFGKH